MIEIPSPPRQPTILIGYGDFGTEVLQRLLSSAALRGFLEWEAPEGAASPSERNLQDLALVSVGSRPDLDDTREGDALELMRDLYQQIRHLPAGESGEAELTEELVRIADALLSARQRDRQEDPRPLALDVFVLAHLDDAGDVGTLNRLLTPALERLSGRTAMEAAVSGAHRLTFVQVLDFEEYWRPRDPRSADLRRAVCDSLERWHERSLQRRPSFGRIYLVDGHTEEGHRDRRQRMEEVVLFLEMLLFEGQRTPLQHLFTRQRDDLHPAATFAVRLLEQPTGLLQRLAAAHFGRRWLAWAAGEGRDGEEDRAAAVRDFLAEYDRDGFETLFRRRQLQELLDREAGELEERLGELPPDLPDWPQRLRHTWEEGAARIREILAGAIAERMEALRRERLTGFKEGLRTAVDDALHDPRGPASPSAVLRELSDLVDRVQRHVLPDPLASPAAGSPPPEVDWSFAEALHRDYRCFREERVEPSRLKRWWPLFAVALAAGATPLTVELTADLLALVPAPDPVGSPPVLRQAHALLGSLVHPTIQGLLLLGGFLGVGLLGVHRPLVARTEHAGHFFDHPERGRFRDRLRAAMAPGGELRAPLQAFLDHLAADMVAATYNDLRRDLAQVRSRLELRHREVGWLRRELQRFLRVHRVTDEGRRSIRSASTAFRRSLEAPEDLEEVQRANPPNPQRFQSVQLQARPFRAWHQRYCKTFLHPLAFIEELSGDFPDPWLTNLSRAGEGDREQRWSRGLEDFVKREGQLRLGFTVPRGEGVPEDERHAIVPTRWRTPDVLRQLVQMRFDGERVHPGSRPGHAYLLRVQTGLPSGVLRGEVR